LSAARSNFSRNLLFGFKNGTARKPSSGEVLAARQTGADKTRTAAPQNGQNEPHYHCKEASAICG